MNENPKACCGFRNNFNSIAPKKKTNDEKPLSKKLTILEKKNKKKRILKEDQEYEKKIDLVDSFINFNLRETPSYAENNLLEDYKELITNIDIESNKKFDVPDFIDDNGSENEFKDVFPEETSDLFTLRTNTENND